MQRFGTAILGCLTIVAVVGASSEARAASDESKFLAALKKVGIATSLSTSTKPCRCLGGLYDNRMGVVTAVRTVIGVYAAECLVPVFDDLGVTKSTVACITSGGASFEDYSK